MTESSDSKTPKPTPTLAELWWEIYNEGDSPTEALALKIRAALERLEKLESERLHWFAKSTEEAENDALRAERDAAINYQNALRGEIHRLQSERDALTKKLEEAEKKWKNEKRAHYHTIGQRDLAEEWADKLAYAIAPMEEIGEHSSANNPWENALALADDWYEKAMAERSRATELAARVEAERHVANEWADVATSAYQWLKNIQDGTSMPGPAIENIEDGIRHCREVASSTPAADLAARSAERDREQREHDDRIRREALKGAWERVQRCTWGQAANTAFNDIKPQLQDAILAPHAGEKGEGE